jgi:hypothetical protein
MPPKQRAAAQPPASTADVDISQAVLAAEFKPIDTLVSYARNARTHSDEQVDQIAASIVEFGFTNPVLADDKGIVAGHGRVMGARKVYASGQVIKLPNGVAIPPGTVPVLNCAGWSEAKRKAYVLADNQLALNAGWDKELLALEFADLEALNFDLDVIGFDQPFIDDVKGKVVHFGDKDAEDTPALLAAPVSRAGDVWICGDSRVMCGDSLSIDDVTKLCDGVTPDLANCDPPYGISVVKGAGKVGGAKAFGSAADLTGKVDGRGKAGFGKVHGSAKNAIIEPNVYAPIIGDDTTETAIGCYKLLTEIGVPVIVLWGGNYFADALPPSRCWLVWDKENSGTFADAELAWTNRDAVVKLLRHQWNGLIKASERGEKRVHPTQKPVALADWVIDTAAPDAQVVIDLFLGSGWTLVSAARRGLSLLGMEMSPAYVDVAVTRWERLTEQPAILEGDGRTFAEVMAERCPPGTVQVTVAEPIKPKRAKAPAKAKPAAGPSA